MYCRNALDRHLPKALIWASYMHLEKKIREMGERAGQQNSGPGEVPLKFKYTSNTVTGQTGSLL